MEVLDAGTLQSVPAVLPGKPVLAAVAVRFGKRDSLTTGYCPWDNKEKNNVTYHDEGKTSRATVTQAELHYVGSITIDEGLLERSGILPGERVQIVDIDNGERFETYTIAGEKGSGVICINGAAARRVQVGDRVIIIAYALMDEAEARAFRPRVLVLDERNAVVRTHDREVHGTIE